MKHPPCNRLYTLDANRNPVKATDLLEWASTFEDLQRVVKQESVGGIEVSTVFLGLDVSLGRATPPLLFETMLFPASRVWGRCSTWAEAEAQHADAVGWARQQEATPHDT